MIVILLIRNIIRAYTIINNNRTNYYHNSNYRYYHHVVITIIIIANIGSHIVGLYRPRSYILYLNKRVCVRACNFGRNRTSASIAYINNLLLQSETLMKTRQALFLIFETTFYCTLENSCCIRNRERGLLGS